MTQPPPNPNFYPIFPWPTWTPPTTTPPLRPPNDPESDDDSWEVRAFAEDTGSLAGTTWPPRSYTCTFCRREFRSAQALGGHMNVHRRDRARLQHQHQLPGPLIGHVASPNSAVEFFQNEAGFCVVCQQLTSHCDGEKGLVEEKGGDGEAVEVREVVEVDLELRLGN